MIYIQITNCEAPKRAISDSELFWERWGIYYSPDDEQGSSENKKNWNKNKEVIPFDISGRSGPRKKTGPGHKKTRWPRHQTSEKVDPKTGSYKPFCSKKKVLLQNKKYERGD